MHLKADTRHRVDVTLNGRERGGYAEPRTLLSDFLRHELGATGTRVGCEHGVCGACTVLVDGRASRSCLMLAVQAQGRELQTVESLSREETLNDLQQAFRKHHALQCGFCTAGILISSTEFLTRVSRPTETEVRDMLSGHLCRCTGYTGIVNAILEVADARDQEVSGPTDKEQENNNV
ncbi:(2Fe-2S)-binding protein [Marinobacter algicola]|uniref:(2Fe-2S)-binding protein n=1 Tax=Marinobacter algicola TaxID=236100 RepID=UPI003BAAD292